MFQRLRNFFRAKNLLLLEKLYQNIDGFAISLAERKRLHIDNPSFTYGEIVPASFINILKLAQPKKGDIFYDLGSGTGKAVFSAALINDWKKCCGIELLPAFYSCSLGLLENFSQLSKKSKSVQFILADLLEVDLSDADIIFIHPTTFSPELWRALSAKLNQLKIGARVIINSKRLDENYFKVTTDAMCLMSWGYSYTRVYQKYT